MKERIGRRLRSNKLTRTWKSIMLLLATPPVLLGQVPSTLLPMTLHVHATSSTGSTPYLSDASSELCATNRRTVFSSITSESEAQMSGMAPTTPFQCRQGGEECFHSTDRTFNSSANLTSSTHAPASAVSEGGKGGGKGKGKLLPKKRSMHSPPSTQTWQTPATLRHQQILQAKITPKTCIF